MESENPKMVRMKAAISSNQVKYENGVITA